MMALLQKPVKPAAPASSAPLPEEAAQLSAWVQRINEAQSKKMSPDRRAELLRRCEASRQRECSKRKAKAVKSHSVRTHALCADGLKQMAMAGGSVQGVVAAQQRWSAAQELSEARMCSKAARWDSARSAGAAGPLEETAREMRAAAAVSDDEDEDEEEAMAEVAAICGTEGGAAALADTRARSDQSFRQLLEQLRREPKSDEEVAAKFSMYETYAGQVEKMRGSLFGIYEENKPTLPRMVEQDMAKRLKAIDSEDSMGILDQTREWFVFHMMRTAERNNRHMEGVLGEFEKKLEFLASHEQAECPVCLEAFDVDGGRAGSRRCTPEVLSCGHRCCKECWGNWVRVYHERPFCPLCKNEEFVAEILSRAGEAAA